MKNKLFILFFCLFLYGCATSLEFRKLESLTSDFNNLSGYRISQNEANIFLDYYRKYPNSDFSNFLSYQVEWQINDKAIEVITHSPFGIQEYRIVSEVTGDSDFLRIYEEGYSWINIYTFKNGELISKTSKKD